MVRNVPFVPELYRIKQETRKKKKAIKPISSPIYKDDNIISRVMSNMRAKSEKGKAKTEVRESRGHTVLIGALRCVKLFRWPA
jgi:hypothetical protein